MAIKKMGRPLMIDLIFAHMVCFVGNDFTSITQCALDVQSILTAPLGVLCGSVIEKRQLTFS